MEKVDLKKVHKELYKTTGKGVKIVEVPKMNYLKIDGNGNPNNEEVFGKRVEALYAAAYTLKFQYKAQEKDFVVMPLQGLWWADKKEFDLDKDKWKWTLMIAMPDYVVQEEVDTAKEKAFEKKGNELIKELRFEEYEEGKSAQIVHIGPYSEETENINKMHDFIEENGMERHGLHHEIYMSDPRKVAPEKMKTILRQPCR